MTPQEYINHLETIIAELESLISLRIKEQNYKDVRTLNEKLQLKRQQLERLRQSIEQNKNTEQN